MNDFSKYRRSHTVIIFIILMNEKSVSISVYIENKTTKIRLSPCVHITFCSHLSLFRNVNFYSHWRMLSHLCRIRVLWFPLKYIATALTYAFRSGLELTTLMGYSSDLEPCAFQLDHTRSLSA